MLAAAKVCRLSLNPIVKSAVPLLRNPITVTSLDFINSASSAKHQALRRFTNSRTEKISHALRRRQAGATGTANPEAAFTIGRGVVAGAGVAGLGVLCFYGLGLSNQEGAIERTALWPEYVRDRIKTTYMYIGGSIIVSVAAAAATLRSPALMRIFASGNLLPNLLLCGALIGSSIAVQSIPYSPGFGPKQIGWLAFSSLVGGMLAPLSFYGGQVVIRAAWYTAGIVGGLSAVAVCAPSDQFLKMGGPLAIGMGLTFASGIGSMFLPPTTMLGASLHSMFLYGGLVVFSGMLLYNSQRIMKTAEQLPPDHYGVARFDPINMSMTIFMDIANIFMRLVVMLGGSNKKR